MKLLRKTKYKKLNNNKAQDNFLLQGTTGDLDLIMPDGIIEYDDYIKLSSDKFARIFAVLVFPQEDYVGFFNYLYNSLGENIDSTDHIEPISGERAIKVLSAEIAKVKSNELLKAQKHGNTDQGALQIIEDLDNLRKRIQLGTEKLFYVRKIFRIWGRTKEELNNNTREFKVKCEERSMIVKELLFNQSEGFKTCLPTPYVGLIPSKFKNNFSAESVAGLLPEGITDFNHPDGIPLGNMLFTNAVFCYDSFIGSPTLPNPMGVILGNSGAGKSVLLKLMIARGSAMGEWSIGFDLEGEFDKITKFTGGQYINIKAGEKTGINPLDIEIEEYEGKRFIDIHGKTAEIRELLDIFSEKFNGRNLMGPEITILEEVIRDLYSKRGIVSSNSESIYQDEEVKTDQGYIITKVKKRMPILSDIKNELEKYEATKELSLIMKLITGDGSLAIFDCETSITLQKGTNIMFGLKNITDSFTKFFSLINIMTFLWAKLSKYEYMKIKKRVTIDEGWYFINYEHTADMLEALDRRGRKYKIAMIIGSQLVEEFISSKAGRAIINIAETKFIMRQSEASAKGMIQTLNLPESYIGFLQNFSPGQAIVISGNKKVSVQIKYYDFETEYVET